ncbi:ATP-grasp domain-containing protein [Chryseobacterium takakiae]|uniref:ATP-grasp domain-containing protein n=1 Tax=Chryseobacterium takakiae TaxID=1302685 RepID=A0A1M4Y3T7_9FLAO|nr:ATP-grasp domain-containing protein [Chryseobacterium takakiae]
MILQKTQYNIQKLRKEVLFKLRYKWHRLIHWEFWPMWAVYLPCIVYYFWISLKSRSFGFFRAVNPAIVHGGMTLEDKNFVNRLLPQNYRAKSFLIECETNLQEIESIIRKNGLEYPVILKPNNGCRGRNVELIRNNESLKKYLENNGNEDLLLEEYISFPNEIGVFYIRFPNEKKGFISGIVEKKGITVTGNGQQTLGELIQYNLRYHSFYLKIFQDDCHQINCIPDANEQIVVSSIGNHARGATFYDVSDKISEKLTDVFNEICSSVDGFYYGRFDVKFNSWEELESGENFRIIELNGAASEPTFIYDPRHSYFFAIKEIIRHWNFMYKIAKFNKKKGHSFTSREDCWKILKEFNPFLTSSGI